MSIIGFVYIMENSAMPGLYKVGCTMRSPRQRAIELSASTGVPCTFDVIYYAEVENPDRVERRVHQHLDRFRYNGNREFFSVAPELIAEVIRGDFTGVWSESFCNNRMSFLASGQVRSEQAIGGVH